MTKREGLALDLLLHDLFSAFLYMNTNNSTTNNSAVQQFSTGSRRNSSEGRGRFDLFPMPINLKMLALHAEKGAKDHGDNNWQLGQPLIRYKESYLRHLNQFHFGATDEDHLTAAIWNLCAIQWTINEIAEGRLPVSLANDFFPKHSDAHNNLAAAILDIDDFVFVGTGCVPAFPPHNPPKTDFEKALASNPTLTAEAYYSNLWGNMQGAEVLLIEKPNGKWDIETRDSEMYWGAKAREWFAYSKHGGSRHSGLFDSKQAAIDATGTVPPARPAPVTAQGVASSAPATDYQQFAKFYPTFTQIGYVMSCVENKNGVKAILVRKNNGKWDIERRDGSAYWGACTNRWYAYQDGDENDRRVNGLYDSQSQALCHFEAIPRLAETTPNPTYVQFRVFYPEVLESEWNDYTVFNQYGARALCIPKTPNSTSRGRTTYDIETTDGRYFLVRSSGSTVKWVEYTQGFDRRNGIFHDRASACDTFDRMTCEYPAQL